MAAAPPLFALLLVLPAVLPSVLALSPYDDLVQQGARLNSTNFILRDPPHGDWLSWQHVGEVPPADPAITTICDCGVRCLSDPGCFSYIHTATSGCQLLPSRGRAASGHASNLTAGQLRFRDGMARLDDYCVSDVECSYVVEGSLCSMESRRCVCQEGLYPLEGQCVTADQLPTTTIATGTGAGGNVTTVDPMSAGSGGATTTVPAGGSGGATTLAPSGGFGGATTLAPSGGSGGATTLAPSGGFGGATTTTTTIRAAITTLSTAATTLAPATNGISLVAGGTKDTMNPFSSTCPSGQVLIGATMPDNGSGQFDSPTHMFCKSLHSVTGSLMPGTKTIVDLSTDGATKRCPMNAMVTALYAPGASTDPFRLGALLCVDFGLSLTTNCGEAMPVLGAVQPWVGNACPPGKVVTGAKIKQNSQGWIETFTCCSPPSDLVVM